MPVLVQYNATVIPAGIHNQNVLAPMVSKAADESTSRNHAKRRCRLCDPVSGQCRHLCVPKPERKTK